MEIIDLTIAKEMVARYQSTRKELVDSTYGIDDTKSIWIPVADIKNFVDSLPEGATGVRVYLAAYDDTEATYPKQTTIITIGTIAGNGGTNVDAIGSESPFLSMEGLQALNHDVLCPPICP